MLGEPAAGRAAATRSVARSSAGPWGMPEIGTDDDTEVAWLDVRGVIVAVNRAWHRFGLDNGGEPGACGVGVSYLAVCEAAGDPTSMGVARAIRRAARGAAPVPVTTTLRCNSAEAVRWFELHVIPRADDAGRSTGAAVVLRRVPTEDSSSGAAMLESSAWDLLDAAPDGLVVIDGSGTIRYLNRRLEELSGYRHGQLMGASLGELVPDAPSHHRDRFVGGPVVSSGDPTTGEGSELVLRRSDGTDVPVEVSLAPVTIASVTMTAASIRDVTDRRAADHARRELLRILDLDPDAVWIVDAETTRIEYANSGAAALLDFAREELVGTELRTMGPSGGGERQRERAAEQQGSGTEHRYDESVIRRTRTGESVPCDSHVLLVVGADGRERLLVVDRDARPRLGEERRRSQHEDLSALMAEVTAMVLADRSAADVHRRVVEGASALLGSGNAAHLPSSAGEAFIEHDDLRLLDELARQVATIVELGNARRAQAELVRLEDRNRIARNLHDTIIQDLIALGMQLASGGADEVHEWREALLDQLEVSIRGLRAVAFEARGPREGDASVTEAVRSMIGEAGRALGHVPELHVSGDLDDLGSSLVRDLLPALREALSNVARHAASSAVAVSVSVADGRLELIVADDGIGCVDRPGEGSGLANLRERAALHDGSVSLRAGPLGGSVLRWTAAVG